MNSLSPRVFLRCLRQTLLLLYCTSGVSDRQRGCCIDAVEDDARAVTDNTISALFSNTADAESAVS
jgi:hypothetical protein